MKNQSNFKAPVILSISSLGAGPIEQTKIKIIKIK